ncbi:MAG: hypothetical protein U0169_18620 [Polyangiaceae bacterium]
MTVEARDPGRQGRSVDLRRHGLLAAVCLLLTVPFWFVKFPPMQDLPVHTATIRVLHDFGDPASGFRKDYRLTLGRTQYVGFYALGHLLAYVTTARGAVVLLACFYLVGTLLALRALLRALGRDPWLCLAAIPGLYGATFGIGLLTYLSAFPVTLYALALLVRKREKPTVLLHVATAFLAVALFYLHIIHLAIFFLGAFVLFPFRGTKKAMAAWIAALLPSVAAVLWWLTMTNIGRRILEVSTSWGRTARPPIGGLLIDVVPWIADAYVDPTDEIVFGVLIVVLVIATRHVAKTGTRALRAPAFAFVPAVLFFLYMTGERSHGPIWPLCQRYVLPAWLLAIPLFALPEAPAVRRKFVAALVAVSILTVANVSWHFVTFDRAARGIDGAIAHMEPGKRVANLIYKPAVWPFRFSPLLHVGSNYQTDKGGVVMFTFAGYDQWPFDFLPDRYPLFDGPAAPRWEFNPDVVAASHPLATRFDYVVAYDRRDYPLPPGFRRTWTDGTWEVLVPCPDCPPGGPATTSATDAP